MAHSKSALKRWRQNERHRERNRPVRSEARTAVKNARAAIAEGGDQAAASLKDAASVLDRAAKHNVIHRNAAARHKSRLMRALNKSASTQPAQAPAKRTRATAAKKTTRKSPAKRASKS